jgi:hypothetical protein
MIKIKKRLRKVTVRLKYGRKRRLEGRREFITGFRQVAQSFLIPNNILATICGGDKAQIRKQKRGNKVKKSGFISAACTQKGAKKACNENGRRSGA